MPPKIFTRIPINIAPVELAMREAIEEDAERLDGGDETELDETILEEKSPE